MWNTSGVKLADVVKRLDAVYAVTSKLRRLFPNAAITERKDKITDESDKDCFYVYARNSLNTYYNRYYNNKVLDIIINFLPQNDETDYMNIIDLIEETFSRYLEIEGSKYLIQNITTQQVEDSHGDFIVFILSIPYLDGALELEEYPLMGGNPEESTMDEMMKEIYINYRERDD